MGLSHTGQRLKAYLDYKNIGINQLGRMTDTSGSQISNIISGKNYGVEKLFSVIEVCPDLNVYWLIYGSGEMILNPELDDNASSAGKPHAQVNEEDIKRLNQEIEALIQEKEALLEAISYKDVSIEVYKHSLEALDATNRELRELLDHYKSMALNQDKNNARSA
jgi:transcriptional regulator with XRE-family HTH domain